jgi:serine/threonine protein kinase
VSLLAHVCQPENLLLSAAGQVKLGDFGFAVLLDGLTKEERCRQVGSPNYMAPELLTAAAADPDYELELVDAYDAGCILFVMCAGHLPFPDEGELLFSMIVSGTVARPKHFSDNLQNLLSHVMERDWRRRYKIGQIRSHIWMRRESGGGSAASSPSPEPVELRQQPAHPPERRGVARGGEMSMTFSSFPVVKVVPKRRESSLSAQSAGGEAAPFINCFEFLANVGIFDLSRMVVKVCFLLSPPLFRLADRGPVVCSPSTITMPFRRPREWTS